MKYRGNLTTAYLLAFVLTYFAAALSAHAQTGTPTQNPTPVQLAVPQQTANVARGQNYEVRVTRVVGFSTGEAAAMSVDFDYEFVGRETVYVKGIGLVPASGSLKYLTLDGRLEFRESAGGAVLATVPLSETVVLQGASFDIPSESDLTPTAREELWTGRGLFTNRARSALNALFPTGFVAADVNGANVWTTSYSRLSNLSECLIGEVAISVSHPFNTRDGMMFRVRYAAREARCLSPRWRKPSQEVKTAAENFVTQLIQQIK